MADATLTAVITADSSGFDKTVKGVKAALGGLQQALSALGVAGFLGKMIKESAEGESAVAQLDAALKSTGGTMKQTAATAGHWGTVTRKSGEYVQDWEKSLKAAQGAMNRLSAKQSAGIPLTQAEHKAYAAAAAAANQYGNALAGATTKQKVWIDGQQQGAGVTRMARDAMLDMAKKLENETRFTDDQIISAEAMLLTFTKIGKDIFPETTEAVLDMSQAMGQDWKNSAIQIGKALNDPINGMTALRRVGVQFTDADEKLVRQLVKSGKLMEAQKFILRELQTEFGGSAKAAGQTLAGALDIASHKVDRLLGSMGDALSPILKGTAGAFGAVVDAMEPLAPILAAVAVGMGAVVLAGMPIVGMIASFLAPIAAITAAVALMKAGWDSDFLGIRTAVTEAVASVQPELAKLGAAFGNFMSILGTGESPAAHVAEMDRGFGPVLKGAPAPSTLEGSGVSSGFASERIKKKKSDFGDRLGMAIDQAWPMVETALGKLAEKIGPAIGRMWEKVRPELEKGIGQLAGLIGQLANQHIVAPFLLELSKLDPATMFNKLAQFFLPGGGFGGMFKDLGLQIDIIGGVQTAVNSAVAWLEGAGRTLWDSTFGILGKAAGNLVSGIGDAIVGSVKSGLIKILKAISGIASVVGVGGVGISIDNAIKALEGKAGGGNVTGGRSYIVGEHGPELFKAPQSGGSIVPNGALGSGGGGGNISIQNLTVYGVQNVDELYAQIRVKAKSMNRPLAGAM